MLRRNNRDGHRRGRRSPLRYLYQHLRWKTRNQVKWDDRKKVNDKDNRNQCKLYFSEGSVIAIIRATTSVRTARGKGF